MPDEHIIYLDPNDELTRVREKIEEVTTRRIIMVVPQQTQLRSNVGWRLLHARARELGKEVQVISPDRQVRAVAKAAGFRVSQPQEGSSTGRTRIPLSQNSRTLIERKGMQRQRFPFNRASTDSQVARQPEPGLAPPYVPEPEELPAETRPPQSTWNEQESPPTRPEEPTSRQQGWEGTEDDLPPIEIVEDDAFDRPYEFSIGEAQAPAARPLAAQPEDHQDEEEHQDLYIPDYDTARRIREAAQEGASSRASTLPQDEQEPESVFPPSRGSQLSEPSYADPFEDEIEELSPSLLPEQRGATFSPDVQDIAPDVAEIPTVEHNIEDVIEPFDSQNFPVDAWDNQFFSPSGERFPGPAANTRGASGRRSGNLQQSADEYDEDYLPPADQSPLIRPSRPTSPASSGVPRAGGRGAQMPPAPPALPVPPPARNVTTRPVSQTSRSQPLAVRPRPESRSRMPAAAPLPPPGSPRRRSQPSRRRGRVATIFVVAELVLLLLIGVGFFYYGTMSTVTITVPSKTVSLNSFKLVASTSTQSKFPNSVTSQLLTYNASVSGQGTATGSTQQGNARATGTVIFTNNGSKNIIIPTGTVLNTTAGAGSIQFVTTASPVVPPTNPNNTLVPVPVQAQNSGSSGNVKAGAITVIPDTSLSAIAQANNLPTSQINLSVNNPNPLTGGGAAQVPAVTQNDVQALKNSLHQQLQAQVNSWLQQQLHQGDIKGTLFPNVVGSARPLPQEQLAQVPPVGTALPNKSFSGTLSVTVSVLVVRSSSLMAAAKSQLNAAALATRPYPYVLSLQSPVQTNVVSSSSSGDGKTLTILMSASGLALLQVDTRAVSAYLTGKTRDQAISAISNGDAGPREVEKVDVTISPSILGFMPFRSENIHIDVIPGTAVPKV
jgi:hypothetical protein